MRSMQIEATGTTRCYVKGGLRSVLAHVSGVSEVHLDPTTGEVPASPLSALAIAAKWLLTVTATAKWYGMRVS